MQINQVTPVLSRKQQLTIVKCPHSQATCSGVVPSNEGSLTLDPRSSRQFTTSTCPPSTARCRGLMPVQNNSLLMTQALWTSTLLYTGIVHNKYKCSIDHELVYAAAYGPGRCFVFTHQVAPLFCMKWCHLESVTSNWKSNPSIDAYYIPIRFETTETKTFLEEVAQQEQDEKQ